MLELLCDAATRRTEIAVKIKPLCIHVGGAPLSSELLKSAQSLVRSVVIGYGLTEAGPGVLLNGRSVCGAKFKFRPLPDSPDLFELLIDSPCIGIFPGKSEKLSH